MLSISLLRCCLHQWVPPAVCLLHWKACSSTRRQLTTSFSMGNRQGLTATPRSWKIISKIAGIVEMVSISWGRGRDIKVHHNILWSIFMKGLLIGNVVWHSLCIDKASIYCLHAFALGKWCTESPSCTANVWSLETFPQWPCVGKSRNSSNVIKMFKWNWSTRCMR